MKTTVALSYFHRKIGPTVYYSYPKNTLSEKLLTSVANIMDIDHIGFFVHFFEEVKSLNHYFEINSDWARGGKEMLTVSIQQNG